MRIILVRERFALISRHSSENSNLGSIARFVARAANATELHTVVVACSEASSPALELGPRPLELVVMVAELARSSVFFLLLFLVWHS